MDDLGKGVKYYYPHEVEIVVEDGVRKAYVKPNPLPKTRLFIKLSEFIDQQFMQRGFNSDRFTTALLEKFNVMEKESTLSTLIAPKKEDEELEFRPIPGTHLRVASGGKGPPTDEMTVSWLNDLELGSLFLSRDSLNQRNFILKLAILVNRNHDKAASLVSFQNLDGPNNTLWVDTKEFCRQYKYLDVIDIIPLDELPKQEEEKNENPIP